ncbi:tRNA uridine-5-carboxymethylaminomethyl(34) synthesis GTPase MnmE [Sulfurimonas sp. HSL-3221]|uniref:tRNA uridine-5-carboxymethylaminomethyl(34) synthesis GTPase MnmE n=1 Tax=Sulfurimonadaceae TaxID=2771471 RepID=UPI001E58C25B|nr:tRNA uridine-5-carboxymethylaminomethyl(34) synthesis GTPase MnmE [Sulfurimonas sp. HSL-3221]UFS63783.1 tRNA uridine-5-carboxymethylaminomethyl(34) synthesis GTPase MnmE [Sulfurimonas sp. HSL-3221]
MIMNDTIAAIATAHGIGSIAIIRISGTQATTIASKLTGQRPLEDRRAHLYPLYNAQNELIDEAIVLFFRGPRSFTSEDVVELQCHGGQIVAEEVLKAALAGGARLATPGEFSRRAFHNGRIDLTEAEAIARLIEARSEDAAKILAKQMKGSLRTFVEGNRDALLEILAYSEVSIDYAEEDLPQDLIDQIIKKLETIAAALRRTLASSERRRGLMQGFKVAIIGKPNVGKSSLLNSLLDYNRAIVSDIAGTTRDTIEEQVRIGSHLIRMVDTAGIREAGDEIERIGIERSIEAVSESDIVIALFDGSRALDGEDKAILSLMEEHQDEREFIAVLNKTDLPQRFDETPLKGYTPLRMSCKQDTSVLIGALQSRMDRQNVSEETMLISQRQTDAVKGALAAIDNAFMPLEDQELELFSFHVGEAIQSLASITRPFDNEEMLDKMFGSFCLGK